MYDDFHSKTRSTPLSKYLKHHCKKIVNGRPVVMPCSVFSNKRYIPACRMLVHQLSFQNAISQFYCNCDISTQPISNAHLSLFNMAAHMNEEREVGREDNNQYVINHFDSLEECVIASAIPRKRGRCVEIHERQQVNKLRYSGGGKVPQDGAYTTLLAKIVSLKLYSTLHYIRTTSMTAANNSGLSTDP